LKIKVLTTLFALLSLLFVGLSPAQAAAQSHSAPTCEKKWFGTKADCTRAEAWRKTTSLTNAALNQKNNTARATEIKKSILKVAGPSMGKTSKGSMSGIDKNAESAINNALGYTGNSVSLNKGYCIQKSLQRYTNTMTANSKLVKDYYNYLNFVIPKKIGTVNISGYKAVLKGSKATVSKIGAYQNVRVLASEIMSCR